MKEGTRVCKINYIVLLQKLITLVIGIGAVVGAMMMWNDPSGKTWGGDSLLEMLRIKMPWPDLFFKNYIPSSIVLLVINGFTQLTATFLLFKRYSFAPWAVLINGLILMIWIILEWWLFGLNTMSNIFFVLGLIEVISAIYHRPRV